MSSLDYLDRFMRSFAGIESNPLDTEWNTFYVLCEFLYEHCNQAVNFERNMTFLKFTSNQEIVDFFIKSAEYRSLIKSLVSVYLLRNELDNRNSKSSDLQPSGRQTTPEKPESKQLAISEEIKVSSL